MPVDLQHAASVAHADAGRRGIVVGETLRGQARSTADTEAPIAFRIARTEIDRVEIIPDAQGMRLAARRDRIDQAAVGELGRALDVAVRGLVDFDRAVGIVAVLGPGDAVAAFRAHRTAQRRQLGGVRMRRSGGDVRRCDGQGNRRRCGGIRFEIAQ